MPDRRSDLTAERPGNEKTCCHHKHEAKGGAVDDRRLRAAGRGLHFAGALLEEFSLFAIHLFREVAKTVHEFLALSQLDSLSCLFNASFPAQFNELFEHTQPFRD